ncbi:MULTISPECIES: hypothetical protein [unclassified Glutamicibacter]|uniref:hypothetical protein n=1 Tax=unclassified Glutamicibacter TaxID=2627139 RepID=UPI003819543A
MENTEVLTEAPDSFRKAVGTIVFEFALLESLASEVITNKARNAVSNGGWSRSGEQFVKELRKCFPQDDEFGVLCDRLQELGGWRNMFIHSEWMFFSDGRASLMKRKHHANSSHPVTFEMNDSIRIGDLDEFIAKVIGLAKDLNPYITKAWDGRYDKG